MKHWLASQNKYFLLLMFVLFLSVLWGINSIVIAIAKSQHLATGNRGDQSVSVAIASNQYSLCANQPQGEDLGNGQKQFYPMKLVVEPWRGEHNVYAIFALPIEYRHTRRQAKMMVKGTGTQWEVTIANPSLYDLTTPDGYFLVIGFFRTRIALWRFVTGTFDQLQQPCNWVLHL